MAIVIVSEYIDDKQNSTGFYWNSLIDLLSSEFTEVKVISTRKSIALYKKDNRNINFIAAPSFNFLEGNVFFKFLHESLVALIFLSLSIKHLKKEDILFCGTNPSFLFLLLGLLKMLKRFKWVTLVHDIFPENTIPAGILKKDSFTYNLLLKLSNISFQKNDEKV